MCRKKAISDLRGRRVTVMGLGRFGGPSRLQTETPDPSATEVVQKARSDLGPSREQEYAGLVVHRFADVHADSERTDADRRRFGFRSGMASLNRSRHHIRPVSRLRTQREGTSPVGSTRPHPKSSLCRSGLRLAAEKNRRVKSRQRSAKGVP